MLLDSTLTAEEPCFRGVSVLVVNFQTCELTIKAVESALAESAAAEVIIVDNASEDGSYEKLVCQFADEAKVMVIASPTNRGFGAGNNLAAAHARCDLLFLLNSDATFTSNSLTPLVNFRITKQEPCIIAPAVLAGATGDLQRGAFGIFPTATRILSQKTKQNSATLTPDWVSGCAVLIDRELFRSLGGFDEEIFLYFEDILLCWKAKARGVGIHRFLDSHVQHLGGQSSASTVKLKREFYSAQDKFLKAIDEPLLLRSLVKSVRFFASVKHRASGSFR
jgi:GT2 family glycosyltransferase